MQDAESRWLLLPAFEFAPAARAESTSWKALFQVTAETTPPGCWQVWQVTHTDEDDADRRGGLQHSASYQNPLALRILADWMSRMERGLQNRMTV